LNNAGIRLRSCIEGVPTWQRWCW